MSIEIKIKKEFETEVVGFNGAALPLGQRSDIEVLATLALQSGNHNLLRYFEKLPTLQELENTKATAFIKKTEEPKTINAKPL